MNRIGIDEAGRGPVIGPLMVAGVSADEDTASRFKVAGVKDSKLLSIRRIFILEKLITSKCSGYELKELSPEYIDSRYAGNTNLNYLELDAMCDIAKNLDGRTVIIDSPSANTKKIKDYVQKRLPDRDLIVENYADKNYVEVSAASILAKAARERAVAEIKKELGHDFGSGYPSDPKTVEFLNELKRKGLLSDEKFKKHIRRTWMTVKNLQNEDLQDFF